MTDEEVNDFVAINFSKSIREQQNLRKVAKLLYIFLITPDEVQSNSSDKCVHHYNIEILNLFDPELQLINTTGDWKQIKRIVKTMLVLDYNKRNDQQSSIQVLN